jgi:hypothetical protein
MHRSHATSVAASGVIHQYALRRPVLLQSGAGGRRRRLLSPWRSRPTCERFGDDPAVRRRDGPDRARDERSVAFAIAPRTPGPAIPFVGKHSSGRGARHSPCWAIPIVRCSADAARSGRPLRRRCARPPWGRRGDRSRGMRSCRSPAPPAARGYRVGRGLLVCRADPAASVLRRRPCCEPVATVLPK